MICKFDNENFSSSRIFCFFSEKIIISCFAVSTFYHIGCFNHDPNSIPVLKGIEKRELDVNKVSAVVINCAELAQANDYKYFAVGYKGVCYSGPQANETYFKKGPAQTKRKCTSGGVGKQGVFVVYTFGKSTNLNENNFAVPSLLNSICEVLIFLALFIVCQSSSAS